MSVFSREKTEERRIMQGELENLQKAIGILKKIEDTLSAAGIVVEEESGGYAMEYFGHQYGPDEGIHLLWEIGVETYNTGDGNPPEVPADFTVSAALFFGENAMFGVSCDVSEGVWGKFFTLLDANSPLRPEAVAFAKAFGMSNALTDADDPVPVTDTRAFEMIVAMASRVKEPFMVNDAVLAEQRGKMN